MFGVVVFTLGDIIALIAGLAILAVIALIALAGRVISGFKNIGEKILRRGTKEDDDEGNG